MRDEQLPPDGKSDHDENDEIPNTLNSEIHIPKSPNNKIHIPTIESTNDEPKTAFDTANSIDVEQNSTIEPNNFEERGSNSIKNELNNIDEVPKFSSDSEPELEANISDHDDSDFGDFESEVPVVSQVNDVNETFKIEAVANVNENFELKILDEVPKTDKKQTEETLNDEINSIDAYFEDLDKKNQVFISAHNMDSMHVS